MRKKRNSGTLPQDAMRTPRVKLKKLRNRKKSSSRWLDRQLNDPYVHAARATGYRSRAAYKLIELNDRFDFLLKGNRVLELGAAPGAWTQVNVAKAGAGKVWAVDVLPMKPVDGSEFLQLDVLEPNAGDIIRAALKDSVNVVESDMAAPATGHAGTDHLRTMALCQAALGIAAAVLKPEGCFVAKVIQGGTEEPLLKLLRTLFKTVKHAKPPASRQDSSELYVVAMGFQSEKASSLEGVL